MIDVMRDEHGYKVMKEPIGDQGLSLRNVWRVIGKEKAELSQGDIIKLGRLRFLVEELVGSESASSTTVKEGIL